MQSFIASRSINAGGISSEVADGKPFCNFGSSKTNGLGGCGMAVIVSGDEWSVTKLIIRQ